MDPKEPAFDQFNSYNDLAVNWGLLEDELGDPAKALDRKKQ